MMQQQCNRCLVTKPVTEFIVRRETGNRRKDCKTCCNKRTAAYVETHREKVLAQKRGHYRKNSERIIRQAKEYRDNNRDKVYSEKYYARKVKYRDENRGACNARIKNWKVRNPGKVASYGRARFAQKRNAVPRWANQKVIERIYAESDRVTKETGIRHHVDHIVPLKSKTVCGLHCEQNMRVIPAVSNLSKNNRTWPDMPEVTNG